MARRDEGGRSGNGDGLCMIDPVVLGGVIKDLATMETAITTELKGLKAEFDKVGVSAQPINDLMNVAHWLHAELPMLRRRHAAAVLLANQGMPLAAPGLKMLSMPEDPAAATKQAGELAAARLRDALDGKPPGMDGIVAASNALRQITGRKDKLTPDDLAFLQGMYGGLGRDVYRIPGQLGDDKAAKSAFVDGLLMLSNEKLGGGFDLLPTEIRQDVRDNAWTYWNVPGGKDRDPAKGFSELAGFLQNRDPQGTISPGKDFAVGIARSIADELRMKEWLKDEYTGGVKPPSEFGNNVYLTKAQGQDLLSLVTMNHEASAELMGNSQFIRLVVGEDWDDDGKAVAGLTSWAVKAAADPSSPEYRLAKEATAELINIVTTNSNDQEDPHSQGFKEALQGMKNNPMIAQAFSRLVAANISDFGEDEPGTLTATGVDGNLEIPTEVRYRFAMLASMDPDARTILQIAAEAYKLTVFTGPHPGSEAATKVAAIDGIIVAAGHNALYYDNVDAADGQNAARKAARADDQARLAVLRQFYDTLAGTVSGGTPIGLAKTALSQLLDDGLKLPEPATVLPGKVPTDADASGVLVPEARGAHDFADAHLRADGDRGTSGLRPELFKKGADGHPQLKELSEMTGEQRRVLRNWALANGGEGYVSTYASLFARTYGDGEKVDDGQVVMKAFTDDPTPR